MSNTHPSTAQKWAISIGPKHTTVTAYGRRLRLSPAESRKLRALMKQRSVTALQAYEMLLNERLTRLYNKSDASMPTNERSAQAVEYSLMHTRQMERALRLCWELFTDEQWALYRHLRKMDDRRHGIAA